MRSGVGRTPLDEPMKRPECVGQTPLPDARAARSRLMCVGRSCFEGKGAGGSLVLALKGKVTIRRS